MAYTNSPIDRARRQTIDEFVAGASGYRFVRHGGLTWAEPIFPSEAKALAKTQMQLRAHTAKRWRLEASGKASETLLIGSSGAWRRAGQVFADAGGFRLMRPGSGPAFFNTRGALERHLDRVAA